MQPAVNGRYLVCKSLDIRLPYYLDFLYRSTFILLNDESDDDAGAFSSEPTSRKAVCLLGLFAGSCWLFVGGGGGGGGGGVKGWVVETMLVWAS